MKLENELAEQETESKAAKREREKLDKAELAYVQGRIEGKPIQDLSDKLWIHENQCLEWDSRHFIEIRNRKVLQVEKTLKKNKTARQDRIETNSLMLAKINKEISKRDLKDVSTDKLILLSTKLQEFLESQLENTGSDFKRL